MNSNVCDLRNHASQFRTKNSRGHDHFGVGAAFETFRSVPQVSATAIQLRTSPGLKAGGAMSSIAIFPAGQDGGFHSGSLRVRATGNPGLHSKSDTAATEPEAQPAQRAI